MTTGGVPVPDWKPFDPAWLVAAAMKQFPDEKSLHVALAGCIRAIGEEPIIYFVDPAKDWHVASDLRLNDTPRGDIEIDILADGRIGGIEFLNGEWRSGTFG